MMEFLGHIWSGLVAFFTIGFVGYVAGFGIARGVISALNWGKEEKKEHKDGREL